MTTETTETTASSYDLAEDEIMISINLFFKTEPQDDDNTNVIFSDATIGGGNVTLEGAETLLKGLGFANLHGTTLEKIVAIACEAPNHDGEVIDLG